MQPLNVSDPERTILFLALLGVFAYQGYQRGVIAELVKLALILAGFAVGRPTLLGLSLIRILNTFYYGLVLMASGGAKALATGDLTGEPMSNALAKARGSQLINAENQDIALFIMMILLIVVGYVVSRNVKRTNPIMGLLAGTFNGLVLTYFFLPALPDQVPIQPPPGAEEVFSQGAPNLGEVGVQIALAPFAILYQQVNTWIIPILILVITLIALTHVKKK
ncbi:MAG: hypothetical protein GXP38_08625 [Chloroflexi bacterium]|nr:hypothetical protein [Chloroflexota bacterium]